MSVMVYQRGVTDDPFRDQDVFSFSRPEPKIPELPKEKCDDYTVPEWFLSNNVKIRDEFDTPEAPPKILFVKHSEVMSTIASQKEQLDEKAQLLAQTEHADVALGVTMKTRIPLTDSLPPPFELPEYQVSNEEYAELRNVTAASFFRDQNGHLASQSFGVFLRSSGATDVCFFDELLSQLANNLSANLISVDREDLEDLGWEYDRQESTLEKPTADSVSADHSMTTFTEMAVHYFGGRSQKKASQGAWNRNKRAISSLINAQSTKQRQHLGFLLPTSAATTTPLLVHVKHYHEFTQVTKGRRFLARLRDSVKERRKSGQAIALIATSAGPELGYADRRMFMSKMNVSDVAIIHIAASKLERLHESKENNRSREVNTRRLKRFLRWRIPHHLTPECLHALQPASSSVSPYAAFWLDSLWDQIRIAHWKDEDFQRAFTQIMGLAFGKKYLEVSEIEAVLHRVSPREEAEESEAKDSAEDVPAVENPLLSEPQIGGEAETRSEMLKRIKADATKHEEELISCIIDPDDLHYTYDDVIMDKETKDTVRHLITLGNAKPKSTSDFILQQVRINGLLFYGPPGTGKTHLSKAIAKASGATMLAVDSAVIQSKYIGETEKYIKAAFSLAAKLHPCVLFLDEVDSLFYRRAPGDKSWQRSALAEFLTGMDGLTSSDRAPLVVVATNRPEDLDDAFYRRLPQKIYFKLPDAAARAQILRLFLRPEDLDPLVDVDALARRTEGYSGSDLRSFCAEAALLWAIDQMNAVPSSSSSSSSPETTVQLSPAHFAKALTKIRPSVTQQTLEGLSDFTHQFNPAAATVPVPSTLASIPRPLPLPLTHQKQSPAPPPAGSCLRKVMAKCGLRFLGPKSRAADRVVPQQQQQQPTRATNIRMAGNQGRGASLEMVDAMVV